MVLRLSVHQTDPFHRVPGLYDLHVQYSDADLFPGTAFPWKYKHWLDILIVSIWAIGGLQLLAIGVIGEYIGKIYLETKERPRYIIEKVLR